MLKPTLLLRGERGLQKSFNLRLIWYRFAKSAILKVEKSTKSASCEVLKSTKSASVFLEGGWKGCGFSSRRVGVFRSMGW